MHGKTTKRLRKLYTILFVGFFIAAFAGFQMPLEKYFGIEVFAVGLPLIFLFFFGGFALLFVLNFVVEQREEKERAQSLQNLAGQFGWHFTKNTHLPLLKEFAASLGMSGGILADGASSNFVNGVFQNRNFAVFDQTYVSGSGKNRTVIKRTLCLLEVREADFPIFCLQQESLSSKFLDYFKEYDTDFATHPQFSQKYTLYGRDKEQIRRFFTPNLLGFYEQIPIVTTIAGGKFLLVYGDRTLDAREIVPQLNFTVNLANLFLRR